MRMAPYLGLALVVACLAILVVYRFSFEPYRNTAIPAPEFFSGIGDVIEHKRRGHSSYFLGETRSDGWWAFFPVLLAAKTPLGLLGLLAAGIVWGKRGSGTWSTIVPLGLGAGILAFATQSRINIGVRHVLPLICSWPYLRRPACCGRGRHADGADGRRGWPWS
jgi:hypothetical protein